MSTRVFFFIAKHPFRTSVAGKGGFDVQFFSVGDLQRLRRGKQALIPARRRRSRPAEHDRNAATRRRDQVCLELPLHRGAVDAVGIQISKLDLTERLRRCDRAVASAPG